MMDQRKTKSQLIEELRALRHRVEVLSSQQLSEKDLRAGEWAGEQLYRALVEHIDAVFWVSTPGVSKQIYVSPSYEKIWGRPLEEVLRVPRTFVDSIHPDDKESFLCTLEKYHARGKSYEQEYRIIRPDKEAIWIHERGYPFRAKRGGPKLMLGICMDVTKQKETESQLRRSERRLSRAQKIAHIGDWEWDVISGEVYWSEEVFRIFKLPRQKPSFQLVLSIVHPEDLDQWENTVQDAVKRAGPIRMDYRVLRPDGSVRWVHGESEVVTDAAGKTVRFVGTVQDITPRKQAESHLALFKTIAETSQIAIAISDPDGRLIYINPAHWRLFGRSLKEARNLNYRAYYPPESVAVLDEVVAPVLARGEDWEGVLDALDAGGRRFPLWERASTVRDAKGKMVCAYGFMRDNSERQAAEKALRESEERFRKIFYEGSIGIVLTSRDRKFFNANPAFCRMLGYTEEELISMTFLDVTHPAHRAADRENVGKLWRGEIRNYRTQKRYLTKNGDVRWGSLSASFIRGRNEEPLYALAIVEDITAQKQAEEKLRALSRQLARAQEAERERIARELHDRLGQSLTALSIGLTAERNARVARAPEASTERLDDCLHIVEALGQYTEDLMCELRPPVLDDYGLVSALRWYAERFEALTGTSVYVECGEEPQRLAKEVETGLFRIAQEALTNVAKHAEAESVRIGVERTPEGLTLSVADDGKGFERGETGTGETGLRWGLAIMRERARSLGGELLVESEPGKGTCVTVELRVGQQGKGVL